MTQPDDIKAFLESSPQLNPKSIEVIQNDKTLNDNSNVINSPVMQFLLLAAQTSQLTQIRKNFDRIAEYINDRESHGWLQNFDNIPVTDAVPAQEIRIDFPAQSISFVNDGPAEIWLRVNQPNHSRRIVKPKEAIEINFETHKLNRFFVQCPSGLTSYFRAMAKG